MATTATTSTDALLANLKPGYTAYFCVRCGHLVGDPRDVTSWSGHCPPQEAGGCDRITSFVKFNDA